MDLESLAMDVTSFPYYKLFRFSHVEIAIWPLLYVKSEWCESSMTGHSTRLSSKRAFHVKCMSGIIDFGRDFSLLQFQYDRWLFKTVTGAVESGKVYKCSPQCALETKSFSSGYWQWQHRFLQDAVRQYGYPSLFLAVSPAE